MAFIFTDGDQAGSHRCLLLQKPTEGPDIQPLTVVLYEVTCAAYEDQLTFLVKVADILCDDGGAISFRPWKGGQSWKGIQWL